jgi:hypothetical protein
MEPDWWLELESTYVERIKERQGLLAEHGDAVLQALPGSELACKELMEMCLQFLCARHPQYFKLDKEEMVFHNDILRTETDLRKTHPLHVLFNNIPEDFAIMLRDDKTGFYLFRAGIICSSLGWNVASKIGMRLHEIHAPIPDYKEKMQFSMDRYVLRNATKCDTHSFADTSPRSRPTSLSRGVLGAWRWTNHYTCHRVIHMRNSADTKWTTSIYHDATSVLTGKRSAAYHFRVP